MISTCCPGWRRPASRRPCRAVSPETAMAAAWLKVRLAGLRASLSWRARAYSANEPWPMPNTSSPTANPVASAPAAHDRAGHVQAGNRVPGGAQARDQADCVGLARHQVPGAPVEPGGMDPQEDLAASGRWPADLLQLPDAGGSVSGLHDRPHRLPSRYRRGPAAGIAGRRGLAGRAFYCLHDHPLSGSVAREASPPCCPPGRCPGRQRPAAGRVLQPTGTAGPGAESAEAAEAGARSSGAGAGKPAPPWSSRNGG